MNYILDYIISLGIWIPRTSDRSYGIKVEGFVNDTIVIIGTSKAVFSLKI